MLLLFGQGNVVGTGSRRGRSRSSRAVGTGTVDVGFGRDERVVVITGNFAGAVAVLGLGSAPELLGMASAG